MSPCSCKDLQGPSLCLCQPAPSIASLALTRWGAPLLRWAAHSQPAAVPCTLLPASQVQPALPADTLSPVTQGGRHRQPQRDRRIRQAQGAGSALQGQRGLASEPILLRTLSRRQNKGCTGVSDPLAACRDELDSTCVAAPPIMSRLLTSVHDMGVTLRPSLTRPSQPASALHIETARGEPYTQLRSDQEGNAVVA